ncbi:MAG: hypothetical protein KIT31_33825 [Deltaproteobacteria bacterium]|nr:hypothetical protein [Deltaproteobacteria bacterium]
MRDLVDRALVVAAVGALERHGRRELVAPLDERLRELREHRRLERGHRERLGIPAPPQQRHLAGLEDDGLGVAQRHDAEERVDRGHLPSDTSNPRAAANPAKPRRHPDGALPLRHTQRLRCAEAARRDVTASAARRPR